MSCTWVITENLGYRASGWPSPVGDHRPGAADSDILRALESPVRFRVVNGAGDVGVLGRVTEVPRDIEDFGFITANDDFGIDPSSGFFDVQVLDAGTWRAL